MKMADVDIDPFGDHDKMDVQPDEMGKIIPLNPRGGGVGGGVEGGSGRRSGRSVYLETRT